MTSGEEASLFPIVVTVLLRADGAVGRVHWLLAVMAFRWQRWLGPVIVPTLMGWPVFTAWSTVFTAWSTIVATWSTVFTAWSTVVATWSTVVPLGTPWMITALRTPCTWMSRAAGCNGIQASAL